MAADLTILLDRLRAGDESARSELMSLIYPELHRIAAIKLAGEPYRDPVLQTTVLIHEAYLRMVGPNELIARNRVHFLSLAATEMQRVLQDRARSRMAAKRGRKPVQVDLDQACLVSGDDLEDFLIFDEALRELETLDSRQCDIVRFRFFAGLTEREIADLLEVSEKTVSREWKHAKRWLTDRLEH